MSLKNRMKILKSIIARSVIFVSFAVTIGAGCAYVLKNVREERFYVIRTLSHRVCFNALISAAL